MDLIIIFPIAVGTILVVVLIITVAFIVRRRLNRSSKSLTSNGTAMGDVGTYNEVRTCEPVPRGTNETNLYELTAPDEDVKPNGRHHGSFISAQTDDSFDDELTIEDEKREGEKTPQQQFDEDAYCSVGELMDNHVQAYVPFEVLENQEDHTYSIADPPNPVVRVRSATNNEYDALNSTT